LKGVILHGGHGTRLRPLTHTGPKQLIPVANKPISQYVLEDLKNSGIEEIAIILGDIYPEKVREHYGDGSRFGVKLSYINQGEPKGIAHAIGLCEGFVREEKFVVYLGDNLLKGGIKNIVDKFSESDLDAMILLCEVKEPQRFGVAEFDENGNLKRLIEKPKVPPSNYALTGIYFLTPAIFEMIKGLKPSWRSELEITDAIQLLIEKGYRVGYDFVSGWWKDTGSPDDILDANRLVLDELNPEIEGTVENDESIQGRVSIGANTKVMKGAIIRGPSVIGENCLIESNVYIGPYTSIGNNVTIKRGELENSIIMDGCLIDVDEKITDSLIGPHSELTSNANAKPKGRRFILGERSKITL
jgi:glucose-1-phosphate thymidylyltransferase